MKSPVRTLIAASLFAAGLVGGSLAFAQAAAQAAYVEGVQMPAWVERNGVKQPLAAGAALQAGDKISTGADSRLLLRMSEGSQVKLGENALFNVSSLASRSENKQTVLTAALEVARGAFRFTTDAKNKLTSKRDVTVRFATVTAGIRGTDLWGKSAGDRDIVCLIEGDIGVQRDGDAEFRMNQALQFYITPKTADNKVDRSKPAPQVVPVPIEKLQEWATETDIGQGKGAATKGGKWKVVFASAPIQDAALGVYDNLRANGYAAEIHPRRAGAQRLYEVRISGLPSKAEAEALGSKLSGLAGVDAPRATL